jgi:ferredoxin
MLGQIAEVVTRLGAPDLAIHPQQCSRLRHRNSTCARCIESCPAHAITVQGTLEVDATQCTNCGVCAAVCPTGALEPTNPTNAELLSRIEQRKGMACLAFACPKAGCGSDERVIQVNSLGRLDESILVGAASWRIGQIMLVDGPCQNCRDAKGCEASEQAIAQSNALLRAFDLPPRVSFVSQLPLFGSHGTPVPNEGLSRRAFFSMLTRDTKAAAALTMSSMLQSANEPQTNVRKGALPQQVPAKRTLLLEALRRLGKPPAPNFAGQFTGWVTCQINENCTGCAMCAYFCPTGALIKTRQEGKTVLVFSAASCTNCGLCREICYCNSIDLAGRTDLPKALAEVSEIFSLPGEPSAAKSSEAKLRRLVESLR